MMKKFLKIVILILLNISFVKAANFSTTASGNGTIAEGGVVTVTFKVNSATPLYGINASLSYDSSLLELTSKQASSGFTLTFGSKIVLDSATPKSGNFAVLVLKFRAKSNFKIGNNTTISLNNVTGSDGNNTVSGTGSKLTVKVASSDNNLSNLTIDSKTIANFKSSTTNYKLIVENSVTKISIGATPSDSSAKVSGTGSKNLAVYNNTFRIVVTSAVGTTKTYVVVVVRKDSQGYAGVRSKDNKLKSLTIEGYELNFDPNHNTYELNVNNDVTSLKINAIANDSSAKVEIGNVNLVVGLNKIIIKVTAEDESVNEYVINVTRNNDIPTTTIDKFKEVADKTTKDTVEVLIKNDEIIKKEDLEIIKSSNKNVIFAYYNEGKLIYAWHISNEDIRTDIDFNSKVLFETDKIDEITKLTNYAEAFYISSPNENKSKTKLKVLTNLKEITKLYYYDGKVHLQSEKIDVDEDSYIEFAFLENDYFLSRMENKKNSDIWAIILGVENVIIAGYCISLIVKKSKKVK